MLRREGIARAVLVACESICIEAGFKAVTLHARVKDDVAIALYLSCGYREVARDGLLVALKRVRPRVLMTKDI